MNDFRYVSPSVCLISISFPRYWDNCSVREGFSNENKKSEYLRRIVGLKEECLFKREGGAPHASAAVFLSLSERLLLALYRLRALEGGRWQYTHDFCLTLCFLWGKHTAVLYTCALTFFHSLSWLWRFSLCAARFYYEFQSNGTMGIHHLKRTYYYHIWLISRVSVACIWKTMLAFMSWYIIIGIWTWKSIYNGTRAQCLKSVILRVRVELY